MIEGVKLKKLIIHTDERGCLFEILRSDDEIFQQFGQAYVTVCNPGWVKGWHYHKKQVDYFCLLKGEAKIVLYDMRENSVTKNQIDEYILKEDQPCVLRIPNGVVHGFECLSDIPCLILNIPTQVYNRNSPDEYRLALDSDEIPYQPWKKRKGW